MNLKNILLAFFTLTVILSAKEFELTSPDGKIIVKIDSNTSLKYSVYLNDEMLLKPSEVFMKLNDDITIGKDCEIENTSTKSVDELVYPVVRQKSEQIRNHFNEFKLTYTNGTAVVFRAYDNGAAYRFETYLDDSVTVYNECVELNFDKNSTVWFPEEIKFNSHNERSYHVKTLGEIDAGKFCSLPALVGTETGTKILVTESDLQDYAGLWLKVSDSKTLTGTHPGYPVKTEQLRDRDVYVREYAEYIAKTIGTRTYPWRILAIAGEDGELITNELVFLLADNLKIEDPSWIRPGKVAWDWWNALNIYGVDFKSGVNTDTYKYYIDFASRFGIEYIILDEGWYKLGDLFDVNPAVDLEELIAYGKQKNVDIILWVVWKTLDDQFTEAMEWFEKLGVAGIKVDFMQRDDQWMVNYYYRVAEEAAKRKLLVDFHGAYKPAGLRRAYPNVITREGVKGLENCKWSEEVTPEHDVTLPFIRMAAGPMDYTPGAMVNAQPRNYHISFSRPMSMGTRCHQLAMYVVYESPLQMLADNPSNYLTEPDFVEFMSSIPVVWDETIVLDAKVSDYIILARRSGNDWYVGAMTDGESREFSFKFDFLEDGNYKMEFYRDGINADNYASDYMFESRNVTNSDEIIIKMAPGGGWTAKIHK